MTARMILSLFAGLALGMAVAMGLGLGERARAQNAQRAEVGSVAIAPGPGGMWIVTGDELRVCMSGPLPAGYALFTPTCGVPLRLE